MEARDVSGGSSSSSLASTSTLGKEREEVQGAELRGLAVVEDKSPAKTLERLTKELEVSLVELNALPSTRKVYLRRGAVLFLTNKKEAINQQQKGLHKARKQLVKLQGGEPSSK